jgi:hypothetical protein
MSKRGALKIHSIGGIQVADVTHVLTTLNNTYNSICVYELLLDAALRYERRGLPAFYFGSAAFSFLWESRFGHIRNWPPDPHVLATFIAPRDRLILKSVELHSPGFWEILGSLNPLETIRKWVGDAHERRKDREYREAAERDRLDLENRLLQTNLMSKQIELMKSVGATESDLAPFRNVLLIDPLLKLERLQDRGLIDGTDDIDKDAE